VVFVVSKNNLMFKNFYCPALNYVSHSRCDFEPKVDAFLFALLVVGCDFCLITNGFKIKMAVKSASFTLLLGMSNMLDLVASDKLT